jgi:S-adenosylmethionine hydrolase
MAGPLVSLLTDFGPDVAAAVCRGVIAGICPDARLLDISHSGTKFAVAEAAWRLVFALPYLPVGIHVAVVDPGVGTERRPVGLRAGRGDVLLGPDNGLLLPAAERLGGIVEARLLAERSFFLEPVSSTFHARDVFAPTAAHLASGRPFADVGPVVDPQSLVPLELPRPTIAEDRLETSVAFVDDFGNVYLAGGPDDLAAAVGSLEPGRPFEVELAAAEGRAAVVERTTWQSTFGGVEPGASLLYRSSTGLLAWSDNQASLARRLGLRAGHGVRIRLAT